MSGSTLNELVEIAPRFHRSVNLEQDYRHSGALDGYVISPLAHDVAERLADGVARKNGPRAFSLIGPYGSGKSAFANFFANLITRGPAYIPAAEGFKKVAPKSWRRTKSALAQVGTLVPALLTGRRAHLGGAILQALRHTADTFWDGRGAKPKVVHDLRALDEQRINDHAVDDARLVQLACDLAEQIAASNHRGAGLVLVVDEFGKLLEWAALHPERSDVFLLQSLAEAAARCSVPFVVLTILHQDIAAYAQRLPRAMREEWTKVAGRFDAIPYLESPQHVVRLLAGALHTRGSVDHLPAAHAIAEAVPIGDIFVGSLPLPECFPLHPYVALTLGPLFRQGLGQNERSLFVFLGSSEPHGLRHWLARADGSVPYRLADLFDYLVANTPAQSRGARLWTTTDHAIHRLSPDSLPEDTALLKAIALLQLAGGTAELRADEATLATAVGITADQLRDAIIRLKQRSTIVYRRFKHAFELWDGSDLDIDVLSKTGRLEVLALGGLAAQVDRTVDPTPVVASRHYFQTGTLRALPVRYVSDLNEARRRTTGPDGALFIVLPDRFSDRADQRDALAAYIAEPDTAPQVFVLANEVVHDLATEYLAMDRALSQTPQLESDPIARRILTERRLAALDQLRQAHRALVSGSPAVPAHWWINGTEHAVHGRPSAQASEIFDATFHRAPKILNELINRHKPSSAGARAQRMVMQALLSHIGEANLGIEGHPPELSIYLSVLHATELHGETADGFALKPPAEGSALAGLWAWIHEHLEAQPRGRATFESVMEAIDRPPFGVRKGIAKVLLFVWYLQHADEVFLYEDNTFIPTPGGALVERLLRQPSSVEVQSARLSGDLKGLALATHAHCFPHLDLERGRIALRVVRQLVRLVGQLSQYAQRTEQLSVEVRRVRAVLAAPRDTVSLLRFALPEALGFDTDVVDFEAFGQQLATALAALKGADDALLLRIEHIVLGLLGGTTQAIKTIAQRAKRIADLPNVPPLTARFAVLTAELDANDPESTDIWRRGIGAAIIGKPIEAWNDGDVVQFAERAEARIRGFISAERLAFQLGKTSEADTLRLMRLDYIDTDGRAGSKFGVARSDAELEPVVTQARQIINELRGQMAPGTSDENLAYVLLRATMQELMSTNIQESS